MFTPTPMETTDEDEWHYDDYGLRLHFSSDSRRLASINYVDNQCRIRVLSVPAGELVSQIFPVDAQGESLNPQSLAFSPNGNRISDRLQQTGLKLKFGISNLARKWPRPGPPAMIGKHWSLPVMVRNFFRRETESEFGIRFQRKN